MREFNNIIEIIVPRTKRQVQKNYTPYLNKETREGKKKLYQINNKAKQTQKMTTGENTKTTELQ